MPQYTLRLLALCVLGLSACGAPTPSLPDGSVELDGGAAADAGSMPGTDAGAEEDGGVTDAGAPDAGEVDAGEPDAGEPDAGEPDAGEPDAGEPDAGAADAGVPSLVAVPAALTVVEDTQGTTQLSATSDAGVTFTFAVEQAPGHGTATITAAGELTYVPAADYAGADSLVFRVSDGVTLATGTVSITVTPVNDAPGITGQQAVSTAEDTARTLTAADLQVADVDDTTGFTVQASAGANYTVSGATVTPAADFNGTLTVPVTVTDSSGAASASFSLTLTVTPVNDAPLLVAQSAITTAEDTARTITLGDLSVTDVDDTVPNGFTVSLAAGMNYTASGATLTPAANFTGALTVFATVSDAAGAVSNVFGLTVTVTPVNDAPVISGQAAAISFAEDTSRALTLADVSFTDVDSMSGFVLTVGAGANYTVSGATITPAANFNGALSVPVTVSDGSATSATFTLTLTVTPVNDAPVITAQNGASTAEDTARTVTLADLQVTDLDDTYPTGFTLVVGDGTNYTRAGAVITPASNFSGTLSVPVSVRDAAGASSNTLSLQVSVTAVNDAPLITGQNAVSFAEDTSRALALTDVTYTDVDSTSGFTLSVGAGSNYTVSGTTVTPAANFTGTLTIPVTVSDGTNTSAVFNLVATVTSVNDAPVITAQRTITTAEDTSRTIVLADLTVTDADHTPPTGFTVSLAAGANYTVNGATLTPSLNFSGTLSVPVTVTDPANAASWPFTATVTVTPVNDAPVITAQATISFAEDTSRALALADLTITDVDSSSFTLTVNGGSNYTVSGTTVTPNANYFGPLTVAVTVSDGTASSSPFNVSLTVTAVNDAPVITGQAAVTVTINEDTARTVALADLVITDVDNPVSGLTVAVLAGTNYTFSGASFTPALNYNGPLTVNVRVSDGAANSNTFALAVTVTPVNDAPVATADGYSANGNTLLTVTSSVLANDTDVESATGTLVVSAFSAVSSRGGTVTMQTNGTFTYLPPSGDLNVTDTFTYTVRDPNGSTSVGTVSVGVVAPRVWYIDNRGAAGDGRSSSPYQTVQQAVVRSGPGDLFFIYGGGAAYSTNVVLQQNQRLIGRPTGLSLPFGATIAPSADPRPVLTSANAAQPLVTLATGAQVLDVNLNATSAGTAVAANGTSSNVVQRVQVQPAKVAFDLTAVTGMAIDGVTSTSLADSVLRVPDGSYVDGLTLRNSSFTNVGDAVGDKALNFGTGFVTGAGPIRNTVTLQNLTLTATGQDGLFLEAAGGTGTLVLDNVNLSAANNGGMGLLVRAEAVNAAPPTLTVTVRNNTTITVGASGDAINAAAEGSGAATLNLDVSASTFTGVSLADDGVRVTADGLNSRVNVRLLSSSFAGFNGRGVAVGSSANGALLQARIENNLLSSMGASSTGILVETMNTTSTAQLVASVANNTVQAGSGGALWARGRTGGAGRLDLVVLNNSGLDAFGGAFAAVDVATVATGIGCLAMSGNRVGGNATYAVALGEVPGSTQQLEGTAASTIAQLLNTNTIPGGATVDTGVALAPLNTCRRPTN